MKVSLLGHPNSGKTSLFNLLTKQQNKTANLANVTVDIFESKAQLSPEVTASVVDLPGVSSLSYFSDSKDELVVNKYIQDNPNDLYLNVVNIGQLQRHLLLSITALAKKLKIILVVNMVDIANLKSHEIENIKNILKKELQIDVVIVSVKKKFGIDELKNIILNKLKKTSDESSSSLNFQDNIMENIQFVSSLQNKIGKIEIKSKKHTELLDKIFLNKIFGVPLFFGIIYLILMITMNIHIIFSGLLDSMAGLFFITIPIKIFDYFNLPSFVTIILADGIGGGIQTMITFLPIIFTLFALLGILEQSGYLARQAFIADSLMQRIGLPGKAFVSLVMGLGCTAACSSGCRTLERESDRRLSLMISPSVSCSAKLPVYIYLGLICFGAQATNIVFLLYTIGIIFAVVNGIFLSRSLFTKAPLPFIVELPDYRMPNLYSIFKSAFKRVKNFLIGLGKTIIPIIAVINILSSVTFSGEITTRDANNSIIATVSKEITPILLPIGVAEDNWQATLSLITGFLAKEVVVATMDAVYFPIDSTEEEVVDIIGSIKTYFLDFFAQFNRNYFDIFEAEGAYSAVAGDIAYKNAFLTSKFDGAVGIFAFLLFTLIYTPCVSAMGAISKEIGKKWAWIVGLWSVFNAYAIASLYYQITTKGLSGLITSSIIIAIYIIIFFLFKYIGTKYDNNNYKFVFTKKTKEY